MVNNEQCPNCAVPVLNPFDPFVYGWLGSGNPQYFLTSGYTVPEDAPSYFQKLYRKVFKKEGVGPRSPFLDSFRLADQRLTIILAVWCAPVPDQRDSVVARLGPVPSHM
jgi:hypothetical protein